MAAIQMGNKYIASNRDSVYIIAEIGQNHQGKIDIAKQMISEAKNIGCDCVKFQKSCLEAKFTRSALDRAYDGENSWGDTYGQHKEYLEFSIEQYEILQKYCNEIGIEFTASAMDEVSLSFLTTLKLPFIKIGSGDANNIPLLKKAAALHDPLVISTGMQTMETIYKIVKIMKDANKVNYALLHCISSYPTEPKDCCLQFISIFKNHFPNIVIGYSGHEIGIDLTKAAVLLGARIIERHFTLDKLQKGSDHKCSLVPNEFIQLVNDIKCFKTKGLLTKVLSINEICILNPRILEPALKPVFSRTVLKCELKCKRKLGKSLVATRNLYIGHTIQSCDLSVKVSEPNGIPADQYEVILGSKLVANIEQDSPLMKHHINV